MQFFKSILVVLILLAVSSASAQRKSKKNADKEVSAESNSDSKFQHFYFQGLREYGLGNYEKAKKAFDQCEELDPNEPGLHYQLSKTLWQMGDKEAALQYAKSGFKLMPENEDMYQYCLEKLLNIRDFEQAVGITESYMTSLPSGSKKIRYSKKLAEYLERAGKSDEAIKVFKDLEFQANEKGQYALDRMRIYMRQNAYEDALGELDLLLEVSPNSVDYNYKKGRVLNLLGREQEALKIFDRVLEIDASHSKSLFESSRILLDSNPELAIDRYAKAFASDDVNMADKVNAYNSAMAQGITKQQALALALTIVETHPDDATVNKLVSDAYLELGNKAKAVEYLEKTVELVPNNYNYITDFISLLYDVGNHEKLRSYSMLALELYPSQPALYLFNGIANMELEDYENAQIMLETGRAYVLGKTALKESFDLSLADLHFQMGDMDKASSIFDGLLKDNSENATVLNNYAYFLARSNERLNDAEKMSKKAIALEGENASFLDTYGWVLFVKKDYKGALSWLERALALDPNSGEILEHCGDANIQLGNVDRALEYWNKAKGAGTQSEILDKKISRKKYYEGK